MKYKIAYISTLFFVALGVSSCSDQILNEEAPHFINSDNLYSDVAGFEAGLNGLYALARMEYSGRTFGNSNDLMSAVMQSGTDIMYNNAQTPRVLNEWGIQNTPTNSYFRSVWEWLYEVINAANTIINRAENPDVAWSEEDKNRVVAEARLFRAWAYRHLTYLWGDVPLTVEESDGASIKTDWTRTPVADIQTLMEEDLLFAEQNLPDLPETDGKLSKGVAQHYLAELYLARGENQMARDKAAELINTGPYQLVTQRYGVEADQQGTAFTDMFLDGNSNRNDGNTEALWVFQNEYQVNGGEGHAIMRRWHVNRYWAIQVDGMNPIQITVENGGRGIARIGPTNYALTLFEDGDDRGSEYAWRWFWLMNNPNQIPAGYALGDTVHVYENRDEMTEDWEWPNTRKWDSAPDENPSDARQYNDLIYLRLANTYLLLAEAEFKLGNVTAAAETINTLRRRAHAAEITAADITIDFILDERARELFSEEHRRYTLIRNDKWLERTQMHNKIAGPVVTERDKLLPIPQDVIDANTTPIRQNPGY